MPSKAVDTRMRNTAVLVYFTEQVLDVNKLERAPPKFGWRYPVPSSERFLLFRDPTNDSLGLATLKHGKTLPNAADSPWAGDNEIHLIEVHHRRVVQVDYKLEGKEGPHPGVFANLVVRILQTGRCMQALRETISKHASKELQEIVVLAPTTQRR
jgi:hypothetical protein